MISMIYYAEVVPYEIFVRNDLEGFPYKIM